MSDPFLQLLSSFVPPPVIRTLEQANQPLTQAQEHTYPAVILFNDISGFTALTEYLAAEGHRGAEEINLLLQNYFGKLIEQVNRHGGEVLKFSGDALVAQWPLEAPDTMEQQLQRAAHCALEIHQTLHNFEAAPGIFLTSRSLITHGEIRMLFVGGEYGRWEPVFTGEPFRLIRHLEPLASPGDVVLPTSAWKLLAPYGEAEPLNAQAVRLRHMQSEIPTTPRAPTLPPAALVNELRRFIPGAVLSRLSSSQISWLSELRPLTVLFIQLQNIQATTPLPQIQEALQTIQQVVYRFEGSLNKVSVDDKGMIVLVAFGLPPLAHDNDAERGVLAAMETHAALEQLGVECAIGIASGTVFCGTVGNNLHREYTILGDTVNLAARLIRPPILCDHNTYREAQRRVVFEALGTIRVKGKSHPIAVYRPLRRTYRTMRSSSTLVGRVEERTLLANQIQKVLRDGDLHTILIEGEAGIGKSRLVEELTHHAESFKMLILQGESDPAINSQPYHSWRGVFSAILEETDLRTVARSDDRDFSPENLQLVRLAPLLNPVLPYPLVDNTLTAQMRGEVRAENTRRLMLHLLQSFARSRPLLIILEDAHWMDSASWTLALHLAEHLKNTLLVLALRPLDSPPQEYHALRAMPNTHHIALKPLTPDQVVELACLRLGVHSLAPEITNFIRERSEGHPFYSEELVYGLRDAGLIRIEGDRAVPATPNLDAAPFPDTLSGLVLSRIDRLEPGPQLTLKVASVIGRTFHYRLLSDIYPIPEQQPYLNRYLKTLEDRQITALAALEPDLTYLFRHVITHEATYNLLPFNQRRQLHHAVALWYETHFADQIDDYLTLLAHHWERAEEPDKALTYRLKAGEQALRQGAYPEAAQHLQQAIALTEHLPHVSPTMRSRIRRLLGTAHLNSGALQEADRQWRLALGELGLSMPEHPLELIMDIPRQLGIIGWQRLFPRRRRINPAVETEAARIFSQISEVAFISSRSLDTVVAELHMLKHARRLGPSVELARAYAGACVIAGLLPLHTLAERYRAQAQALVRSLPDANARIQVNLRLAFYQIGKADCSQAEASLLEAAQIAQALGDHRRYGECLATAAMAALYQGRLDAAYRYYTALVQVGTRHDNPLQMAWALDGLALIMLWMERAEEAQRYVEASTPYLERTHDPSQQLVHLGAAALTALALDERQQAQTLSDRLLEHLRASQLTLYSTLEGYAAPATVYLSLAASASPAERPRYLKRAREALKALYRYSRIFPLGRPRQARLEGQLAELEGNLRQARKAYHEALHQAESLRLPVEIAHAMVALGTLDKHYTDLKTTGENILQHLKHTQLE